MPRVSAPIEERGSCGAWNPGLDSTIPAAIRPLSTIFRPENVFTSYAAATELRGLTGLSLSELVVFRPERLALHELLIRVTADFEVPDGSRIGDLGINFRNIARRLLERHVAPNMSLLRQAYDEVGAALGAAVERALAEALAPRPAAPHPARRRMFGRAGSIRQTTAAPAAERGWGPGETSMLERLAAGAADPCYAAACRSLARVMSALFATHGHAWGSRDLIASVASNLAINAIGSDAIGRKLDPIVRTAAAAEGFRLLPSQDRPVVINTKGASASGKSTLRPLQRDLAGAIGVSWGDFALISPDIWRKQLLDYDSLGDSYKYAGPFTGEELQIVDSKLDRHMARKNERGDMPHLLIDRFRFDSFAPDSNEAGSNLLTRFGRTVHLFFVITPPDQLVERAWRRGLEFGRYKAVDDTLAHAVEAYGGIPVVFFTWVPRDDKQTRFEFLDNSVAYGERPRTVAFGDNATFNVLDVPNMINIDRFARINVNAREPSALFTDRSQLAPESNTAFLRRCRDEFRVLNLVEQSTGRIYLHVDGGVAVWKDPSALQRACEDADTRAGVLSVAGEQAIARAVAVSEPRYLSSCAESANIPTLGRWGPRRPG
jgi:hypothetical protein